MYLGACAGTKEGMVRFLMTLLALRFENDASFNPKAIHPWK